MREEIGYFRLNYKNQTYAKNHLFQRLKMILIYMVTLSLQNVTTNSEFDDKRNRSNSNIGQKENIFLGRI